jgi:hypothetical protein
MRLLMSQIRGAFRSVRVFKEWGIMPTSRFRQFVAVAFGALALGLAFAAPAQASPVAAPATTSATPAFTKLVHPSVTPCGTSTVSLKWSIVSVAVTGGVITNKCPAGSYVQLFITWKGHSSIKLGTAGPRSVARVASKSWRAAFPAHITVTACEHYKGWHCGAGKSV